MKIILMVVSIYEQFRLCNLCSYNLDGYPLSGSTSSDDANGECSQKILLYCTVYI